MHSDKSKYLKIESRKCQIKIHAMHAIKVGSLICNISNSFLHEPTYLFSFRCMFGDLCTLFVNLPYCVVKTLKFVNSEDLSLVLNYMMAH